MAMKFAQLYFTYKDALANLTDEECGRVIKALMVYATEGKRPAFQPRSLEQQTYLMLARQYDSDAASYGKKSSAGSKGGRPARGSPKEPETEPDQDPEIETTEKHKKSAFGRFPHEGKGREGIGRESSSSISSSVHEDEPDAADAATTMTTILADLFEENVAKATPYVRDRISGLLANGTDAELIRRAIEEGAAHGARKWAYIRQTLDNWANESITTTAALDARKAHAQGGRNARVDRATPSGNDILARATRRPLRLKRED